MTRETKIGLLVGMGVIILVGVLITDHFSQARRQQQQALAEFQRPSDEMEGVTPRVPERDRPLPPPSGGEASQQAEAEQSDESETIASAPMDHRDGLLFRSADREESAAGGTESQEQAAGASDVNDEAQGASEARAEARSQDRAHHVQPGESLYTIAEEYYGNGGYWRTIYEANEDKMNGPSDLQQGVRLVIPNRAGQVRAGEASEVGGDDAAAAVEEPTTRMYEIQSGDSLAKLARRFYGSADQWRKLYELNEDRLEDPDTIIPGKQIRVPAG